MNNETPTDLKPLNGTKTHPLTKHSRSVLIHLNDGPSPCYEFNPGVRDRLIRGGLVEIVQLPSPYKKHKGRLLSFLQITDAGRKELQS